MTNEKIAEVFKNCWSCTAHRGGLAYHLNEDDMKLVANALEKQIPKKPTRDWKCPACGLDAFGDGYFVAYKAFCDECGQAIDWSE